MVAVTIYMPNIAFGLDSFELSLGDVSIVAVFVCANGPSNTLYDTVLASKFNATEGGL